MSLAPTKYRMTPAPSESESERVSVCASVCSCWCLCVCVVCDICHKDILCFGLRLALAGCKISVSGFIPANDRGNND